MSKQKSAFFCQECGYEAPKWLGKCPSCSSWNTFVEEIVASGKQSISFSADTRNAKPTLINEIENLVENRMQLVDVELNRVLGGGLVKGALVLIGGEPGIGKSTLMLQLALRLKNLRVLYVSGEESEEQIRMRAERLGLENPRCLVLMETSVENILMHAQEIKPDVLIMHPGPINRGVEIDSDIADGERSVILEQVTNGLAVRMAVLFLINGGKGPQELSAN